MEDPADDGLTARVLRFASALSTRAPYRPPADAEREDAATAILAALTGEAPSLAHLGFTLTKGVDAGRHHVLVASVPGAERGWGLYAADPEAPARLVIEVPHPNSDLYTEHAGIALYHTKPGAVLLMAGAHRSTGRRAADVAHRTDSVFHAVAARLMRLPQVQLHGFADAALPGTDVIVSAGAGEAGAAHDAVADALRDVGFRVCRSWAGRCGDLEGRTNVQGLLAARLGTPFLHVELNRSTRRSPARRAAAVRALSVFG